MIKALLQYLVFTYRIRSILFTMPIKPYIIWLLPTPLTSFSIPQLTMLQPHQPSYCSSVYHSPPPPQGLPSCYVLCLKHFCFHSSSALTPSCLSSYIRACLTAQDKLLPPIMVFPITLFCPFIALSQLVIMHVYVL